MTKWRLKLASYFAALPWEVLGEDTEKPGIPKTLCKILQLDEKLIEQAAICVTAAQGLLPHGQDWEEFFKRPVFFHTLSGRIREIEVTADQAKILGKVIVEEVAALAVIHSPSSKEKSLYLEVWRRLPQIIAKRCGSWSDFFPAFSQLPDRNIWQQAQLAAAFSTTYDEETTACRPALFSFNLGSVQESVFTARRTQDFWAGSFIHSFIVWKIIAKLIQQYGPETILYPDLQDQPLVDSWLINQKVTVAEPSEAEKKIAGFPNSFTLLLPQGEANTAGEIVESELTAVRDEMFAAVDKLIKYALSSDTQLQEKIDKITEANIRNLQRREGVKKALRSLQSGTVLSQEWEEIWQRQKSHFWSEDYFYVSVPWTNDRAAEPTKWIYEQYAMLLSEVPTVPSYQERLKLLESVCQDIGGAERMSLLYQPASALTGRMLAAGKKLRSFKQSVEPGYKCSQCGTRQALTVSRDTSQEEMILANLWELLSFLNIPNKLSLRSHIKSGEYLCSVCLVKRLVYIAYLSVELNLQPTGWFPPVSSIATINCKNQIVKASNDSESMYEKLVIYVKQMENLFLQAGWFAKNTLQSTDKDAVFLYFSTLDGFWLYEEYFMPERIEKEFGIPCNGRLEKERSAALQALKNLLQEIRVHNKSARRLVPLPSRYYAVLYLDGDKMGEWVQGKRNPFLSDLLTDKVMLKPEFAHLKRPMEPVINGAISRALKNFSQILVPQIVEKYLGKLIYAGGDDVMAIVPINNCLKLSSRLCSAFNGELSNQPGWRSCQKGELLLMDGGTVSCGIAIAHHAHPLSLVLDSVATVLKRDAKESMGRNAFAVRVEKRSGEPLTVSAKWQIDGINIPECIEKLQYWWQRGLATTLPYEMAMESEGLEAIISEESAEAVNQRLFCQQGRLAYLIERHGQNMMADEREAAKQEIINLLRVLDDQAQKNGEKNQAWQQTVDVLLLSRFISHGGDE